MFIFINFIFFFYIDLVIFWSLKTSKRTIIDKKILELNIHEWEITFSLYWHYGKNLQKNYKKKNKYNNYTIQYKLLLIEKNI